MYLQPWTRAIRLIEISTEFKIRMFFLIEKVGSR